MSRFVRRLAGARWREIAGEAFAITSLVAQGLCAVHVISEHVLGVVFARTLSLCLSRERCPDVLSLSSLLQPRGPSMLPALSLEGDVVLTDKVSARYGWVVPGDVVLLLSPDDPRKLIIKRVLGVEGDAVTYFVDAGNNDASKTVVVPQGHMWVQGDNIYTSNDSRQFGPVPYGLVKGKMSYRIWPLTRFGSISKGVGHSVEVRYISSHT